MDRSSIFSTLVKDENSYTNLLCALMKRSNVFCNQVLRLLLDDDTRSLPSPSSQNTA